MTGPTRLYHLALRDLHAATGATFAVHGEWSLPEHYGDPAAEYAALRSSAVVADVSHRSRFIVSGTDALDVLQAALTGRLDELEEGRAMRAVLLDGAGDIRDLVLVARTGGIAYTLSGEPGQRETLRAALDDHIGEGFDLRIDDRTESTCLLTVTGPEAAVTVRDHLSEALPARLPPMTCVPFEFHGFRSLAVRTSATGEDGFEFMLAPAVAQHAIETLRDAGIALAGAAALDAARIESCLPAYDPDLVLGLSPAEADLDVLLGIPGGRERWMLSAVLLETPAPLPAGTPIRHGGTGVGELRSCVRSPGLGATIGLAVVESRIALPGTALDLDGERATIVAKPLYRRRN